MKNFSTLIFISLILILATATNSTNSTNNTNSSNTTNDTDVVEPYTYCSAQCIDYISVCSDVNFEDCTVCADSLYDLIPNDDGSCSLLDQHEIIYHEL